MAEERLLERIYNLENPESQVGTGISRAISSVLNHLNLLLNTRKGSVLLDLEFGIPDLTNFPSESMETMGQKMATEIQHFISKYEPRLTRVKIIYETNPRQELSLHFRLEGFLKEKGNIPITFETWIDPNGQVKISE